MDYISVVICIFIKVSQFHCFDNFPEVHEEQTSYELDLPLVLTPLIKAGKIKEAQEASIVKFKDLEGVTSYAAYLTVDEIYNSNLFFWFFPAHADYASAPVILWLQGGPGTTSLYGLFLENGPFIIKRKHGLKLRKYSWTENHSVIYIDNPVGTGYSFTSEGGYAKNQTIIGKHLYNAMLQFFQLFPELQKNNFFISGESYGGKYAPALGYTIYKNNQNARQKINLQGIAIGNGLCDPEHQLDYSDYLYGIGLVDTNGRSQLEQLQDEILKNIQEKQWLKAAEARARLIQNNSSLFTNITHLDNTYNYLLSNSYTDIKKEMTEYIQQSGIKAAIHVGNATLDVYAKSVKLNLLEDMMQSVAPWISELLEHYRILFYNGQLDVRVAYSLTVNFLQNLKSGASSGYKSATRHTWYVNSQPAGYVKEAGNLIEVLVRNAGHLVPMDQPQWALDLITKFTRNEPLNTY